MNGLVTIEPLKQAFNWKSHGENIAANLNQGFKIYYTTDGTEPDATSNEYTAPFHMDKGELKAISILNQQKGALHQEQLGFIKQGWKLLAASSEEQKQTASAAFDENPDTYWTSKESTEPHFIAIDLGKTNTLNGFAYTPQKQHAKGMIEKGVIKISNDGINWEIVENFRFGNLINDPVKRYHYFKKPAEARYVRIEAIEIAANGKVATAAEIDLF